MRHYQPLRPQVYVDEIQTVIRNAVTHRRVLDVQMEAERIADLSGCSVPTVVATLLEAGRQRGIRMELPRREDAEGPQTSH
jgi:hypothetical protein